MREELDAALVKKYPKIFRNRHGDMRETLMCWGFCVGDGWYDIIDVLCENIQSHIDHRRNQRSIALRFNRALRSALKTGSPKALYNYFTPKHRTYDVIPDWVMDYTKKAIEKGEYKEVPEIPSQVVAVQVKEKFGGLRFYTDGGDEQTYAMIRMAESMAVRTCEDCGNPGTTRYGGWHRTLCDKHAEERGYYTDGSE